MVRRGERRGGEERGEEEKGGLMRYLRGSAADYSQSPGASCREGELD